MFQHQFKNNTQNVEVLLFFQPNARDRRFLFYSNRPSETLFNF